MASKDTSLATTSWQEAAPVTRDDFAFGNGILFADVSGGKRHARASVAELQEHFKSGSANDHTAHWFEAQLLHYDLKPSKVKSVARMRIFDAVNGGLSIPARISKLEAELKKEWTKLDREAKKVFQSQVASATPTAIYTPAATDKAAPSSNLVPGMESVMIQAELILRAATTTVNLKREAAEPVAFESAPKRPKSEHIAFQSAPEWPKTEPSPESNAMGVRSDIAITRRGGIHQSPSRTRETRPMDFYSVPEPMPQQTKPSPMPRQTARRSRSFLLQGYRPPFHGHYGEVEHGYSHQTGGYQTGTYGDDNDGGSPVPLKALGLLNGEYDTRSETVEREWPRLSHNLSLVFTIAGREMWGQFDLGVVEGIMHFDERPAMSSYDRVPFTWRGRENEGMTLYGNNNHGWVQFLGDGHIEGELAYMSIKFSGRRHSGQGTRSPVDSQKMKKDWSEYTEELYEEENRRRWH